MPAWLAPVATGILSAAGGALTNRSNAKQARQQMAFQERMSSTAAQRSVDDFRAAGLNPALAYGNTASSPAGASATMGDAVTSGVSSAQQSRALRATLDSQYETQRLTRVQADAEAKRGVAAEMQANLTALEARKLQSDWNFQRTTQPAQLRQMSADALMRELEIPGARNNARLNEKMGIARPIIGDLLTGARAAAGVIPAFRSLRRP